MIYDMTAFLGPFERRSVGCEPQELASRVGAWDVERVFAGRIDTLYLENGNGVVKPIVPSRFGNTVLESVPVVDPTLPNWQDVLLAQFEANGLKLPIVRLHPGHHGYSIDDERILGPLIEWTHHHGAAVQVILSLDDARRRHPANMVQDVPVPAFSELAKRFPQQKFLASGATFAALSALAKDRPPNLWADIGRVEAAAGLARLFESGWGERLVFASFAPLLIVHSAIARVLADLNDKDATQVMRLNADALLAGD